MGETRGGDNQSREASGVDGRGERRWRQRSLGRRNGAQWTASRCRCSMAARVPTLLVLHDCEVMTAWQPYHAALATRFTVLAPSHPGFGLRSGLRPSRDRRSGIPLPGFHRCLGSQSVDILGLGMGGWIAAEMAVRCSHPLRHLVLADTVGIKVSGRTEVDIVETFILSREQLLEVGWHDRGPGR